MVISFITEQGGVGKTSLCLNLAWYLSDQGKKVLMLDMDPQGGNLSFMMGVPDLEEKKGIYDVVTDPEHCNINETVYELKDNLYIIPANEHTIRLADALDHSEDGYLTIRNIIKPLTSQYDYIFIDPNPTPSIIHVAALSASDKIIIPLVPDAKSIEGTKHIIDTYESVKNEINANLEVLGLVYNKYEGRTVLSRTIEAEMRGYCGAKKVPIVSVKIPNNVSIAETPLYNAGITECSPKSKGAVAYRELADEIFQLG